jgi:hypothetical protein
MSDVLARYGGVVLPALMSMSQIHCRSDTRTCHVSARYGKVVPEEIEKLVEECWDPQPDNRPSFAQIAKRLQVMFDAMPAQKKKKCSVM